MQPIVQSGVDGLRAQFPGSNVVVVDDPSGGAYVIVDQLDLGAKFLPSWSWLGAHLSPQLPYADIYPLFLGGDVRMASGAIWQAPVTPSHVFQGRNALQISLRSKGGDQLLQTPAQKFLKVLHWLKERA
jgi:hypothetical protein